MAPTAAEEVAFVQVPLQAVADPVFYKMRNTYQPTRLLYFAHIMTKIVKAKSDVPRPSPLQWHLLRLPCQSQSQNCLAGEDQYRYHL